MRNIFALFILFVTMSMKLWSMDPQEWVMVHPLQVCSICQSYIFSNDIYMRCCQAPCHYECLKQWSQHGIRCGNCECDVRGASLIYAIEHQDLALIKKLLIPDYKVSTDHIKAAMRICSEDVISYLLAYTDGDFNEYAMEAIANHDINWVEYFFHKTEWAKTLTENQILPFVQAASHNSNMVASIKWRINLNKFAYKK